MRLASHGSRLASRAAVDVQHDAGVERFPLAERSQRSHGGGDFSRSRPTTTTRARRAADSFARVHAIPDAPPTMTLCGSAPRARSTSAGFGRRHRRQADAFVAVSAATVIWPTSKSTPLANGARSRRKTFGSAKIWM